MKYGSQVKQGYAGMAIDYDLSPGVRFPVALEECKQPYAGYALMRPSTTSIPIALP